MSSSRAWLLSYSRYATIWGHAQIRMGGGTKKKSLNISPIHEKESFILKFTSNGRKEKKRHRIFLRLGSWLVGYWVGAICIARRPAAAWDEGISTQSFFRRPVDSPALIFLWHFTKSFSFKADHLDSFDHKEIETAKTLINHCPPWAPTSIDHITRALDVAILRAGPVS